MRTYSSELELLGIGKRASHDLHLTSNRSSIKLPQRNLKMSNHPPARYFEIGCRIPKEYFWVIGWGESDVGIETGSYDAALHMAGIENYNVMLYTSVLPPETVELPHLPDIHHGSVLEGIIAVQHTDKPGTRITAGLLMAKVYRKSNDSYLGGFACEYAGNGSIEKAEVNLREAMRQLFARRYETTIYKLEYGKSLVRTYTPKKLFGTILVGIGFASYLVPVLKSDVEVTLSHKDKSHVQYTTK
jgi:arginine decarboxylase